MKRKTILMQGRRVVLAACSLLIGAACLQSCKDDDDNEVLTGQPSWLGESIYVQLQKEGNYTTLLKLIDDVDDNKEVLSTTGSKTLFAANDEAFSKWFADNNWKVSSYEQLSPVQKKVLLNSSMLDNAYLLELMSNVKATATDGRPQAGLAMRRPSSISIYDSITLLRPEEMPKAESWKAVREKGKPIYIFKDNSSAPLIHFLPAFMQRNGITAEDLKYLTNGRGQSADEAWINGAQIINSDKEECQGIDYDITCKNGYIHKVDRVIEASPNMAEILHQHDNLSLWTSIIDRFSAPYDKTASQTMDNNETQLKKWQRLYNMSDNDTVYTWRYLSSQLDGTPAQKKLNDSYPNADKPAKAWLRFDPGWNEYIYTNTSGQDLYYDAGAMLVPTNDALLEWWNGEGRDLQEEYKELDSVPLYTIAKLVNVNMMSNFIETVPTKFSNILNDAKEELGVKKEDIVESYMGCNGVVYVLNKLYTPAEFASVAYPATAHPSTMSIISWAIDNLNFLPYLLAMDQTYTMLLPTNNAMLYYVDPFSYNTTTPTCISFIYDEKTETIKGDRYNVTVDEEGNLQIGSRTKTDLDNSVIQNRLKDLVDQLIIIGDVTDGREYYKTKGGSYVRVTREDGKIKVQGAYQIAHNGGFIIDPANDKEMVPKRNGKSLIIDGGIPLTAENSVYNVLNDNPDHCSEFLSLFNGGGSDNLLAQTDGKGTDMRRPAGGNSNYNVRLFNNYNYTVYVPTNEKVRELIDNGYLPTWNDYDAISSTDQEWKDAAKNGLSGLTAKQLADSAKIIIKEMITDFVRYHIQDNSIAIGSVLNTTTQEYESMQRNVETDRFFGLNTVLTPTSLDVTDARGETSHVVTSNGLYNKLCREYWFKGSTSETPILYFVSSAVVHQIDGVLLAKPFTKTWKERLEELKKLPEESSEEEN